MSPIEARGLTGIEMNICGGDYVENMVVVLIKAHFRTLGKLILNFPRLGAKCSLRRTCGNICKGIKAQN